jgi:hypothetical protein
MEEEIPWWHHDFVMLSGPLEPPGCALHLGVKLELKVPSDVFLAR